LASILGFGSYLPERVLTNEDLAERLDLSPDWIFEKSGIRTRRIADESQTIADLGVAAAKNCLTAAGWEIKDISLLMVASGSWEKRFPGPAAGVARQLGLEGIPCLDIPMASAGSLFGLSLASRLTAEIGPILLVAAEKMSPIAMREPLDKNIAILFGDGAGACLLAPQGGALEIVDSLLRSDGAYEADLCRESDGRLAMNGQTVIMQAARKLPSVISDLLHKHAIRAGDVECFLIHQANQNLVLRVAKALTVAGQRFYSNIERYGNTSSASMLIASAEYFREQPIVPSAIYCFAAFGAGFHWGALLAHGRSPV